MTCIGQNRMGNLLRKNLAITKPGFVTEIGIRARTDQGDVVIFKFFQQLLEFSNFGRSDEGEVEWIKVKHKPLAFVIRAADRFVFPFAVRGGTPLRCRLANKTHRNSPLAIRNSTHSNGWFPAKVQGMIARVKGG